MVRRFILLILAVAAMLLIVAIVRTARLEPMAVAHSKPAILLLAVDERQAAEHLAGAVRFKTVSYEDRAQIDYRKLDGLRDYLATTYPELHKALNREIVGGHSLLFTWQGTDPSLTPYLVMGHMDVVPVPPEAEPKWHQPPFAGNIADGFIWGRGTMDDKGAVIGIMEAVEALLKSGFRPRRTLYLAFGHDEEIEGSGARSIVELLNSRGIKLEYVIDEGGIILRDQFPGVAQPVALVGVAEKGYASVELTASAKGGHSSMPPAQSAIGELSAALVRLEKNQMPAHFSGIAEQTLNSIAPAASFPQRLVFANGWLFGPVLKLALAAAPTSNALVRTTTAETVVGGGVKDNVLPTEARAVVNFRILPGDSVESVADHVRRTIADRNVAVRVLEGAHNPSFVSPADSAAFQAIRESIGETFPEVAAVAPYLVLGATDSRSYQPLTNNIYRFLPQIAAAGDTARVHGIDERVPIQGFARSVAFYAQLIRNSDQ